MMLLQVALLGWGAYRHSPVVDEVAYLPAGISHWETGTFDLASVSPPLVRLGAAIPVLLFGNPVTDWSSVPLTPGARPEWKAGPQFVEINGARTVWLMTLGRWGCLPFALMGSFACWRWATESYGQWAGLCALWLWCFCPNVLGAGFLLCPDFGGAAAGALAGYTSWRWLRQPGAWRGAGAGVGLGVALLARTTWIILIPLVICEWIACRWAWKGNVPGLRRSSWGLLGVLASALYVVNLGYAFQGTFQPLQEFTFVSRSLTGNVNGEQGNRFAGTWLGRVPIPVPKDYLIGMDLQKRDFEYSSWSFLAGERRLGGWWYFYLYGLGIKVPLGVLGLVLMAAALSLRREFRESWLTEVALVAPIAIVLLTVSAQTGFSHHVRYAYGILPFLFVWVSKVGRAFSRHRKWMSAAVATCLVGQAVSSLAAYPHSMSYFNEAIGGPRNGYRHLVNSSVDWGQDLLFLHEWIESHPEARPLHLAYFGRINPGFAGIDYELIADGTSFSDKPLATADLRPGWYAVSVTLVQGRPYQEFRPEGGVRDLPERALESFLKMNPVDSVGYSILIYRLDEPRER